MPRRSETPSAGDRGRPRLAGDADPAPAAAAAESPLVVSRLFTASGVLPGAVEAGPTGRGPRGHAASDAAAATRAPPRERAESGGVGADLEALRLLRCEAQDLAAHLRDVREGRSALADEARFLRKTMEDVERLVSGIPTSEEPLRRIHNLWEKIRLSPLARALGDPVPSAPPVEVLRVEERATALVNEIGFVTIPDRLNRWLAHAPPGYHVPFHEVFEDEMPDEEARTRLLRFLAYNPAAVEGGLVDVSRGLVFRYATTPARRARTLASLAGAFLAAALALRLGVVLAFPAFATPDPNRYLFLWLVLLGGAAVHAVVTAAGTRGGRPPLVSLGTLPLWVDARAGQILWKLSLSLATLGALFAALPDADVTPLTAFLAGFAIDSVADGLGAALDRKLTGRGRRGRAAIPP